LLFWCLTFRIESLPSLLLGEPWSIYASAFAVNVTGEPQSARAVTDQVWVTGSETLPAASAARTRKVCAPTASPSYVRDEMQLSNAAPSWAVHSNAAVVEVVLVAGALVEVTAGGVVSSSSMVQGHCRAGRRHGRSCRRCRG
jgi:hypothetical protein